MEKVAFKPRRLGHVNLWASDLEESIRFYQDICGLELVRRESAILIAFLTNGNTHHDIGLVEVSNGKDRYGRNGLLQIPKERGLAPGLNHLGWEQEHRDELVQAYKRASAAGVKIHRTVDHQISNSVYLSDPDGNSHEFYADQIRDWRSIYNLDHDDEVTGAWNPLESAPSIEPLYTADPPMRRVPHAPVQTSHLIGVGFTTHDVAGMSKFLEDVAGLEPSPNQTVDAQSTVFRGNIGRPDLVLTGVPAPQPRGLAWIRLLLAQEHDFDDVQADLKAKGVEGTAMQVDGVPVLRIHDPDGLSVDFINPSVAQQFKLAD